MGRYCPMNGNHADLEKTNMIRNLSADIEVRLSAWELHVLCEALERYPAHEAHKAALLYKLGESADWHDRKARQMA
jgi:hypothetical protein